MEYKGLTALVTGASSGLGEEFARQLASSGADLVLVSRSKDKLDLLADNLRAQAKIQVFVMPADLGSPESVANLAASIQERGINVDILVNNAGLGSFRNFLETPLDAQIQAIDVNVGALVKLTHMFAPGMETRKRGGIINVASAAAFQPAPGAAVYAATKAFVLSFSEALSFELRKSGVRVLVSCPGPVATNFFANMNLKLNKSQMDQPATVVRQTLTAFEKGKQIVFPGKLKNFLGTFGARLLPRKTMLRMTAAIVNQFNAR